MRTRHRQTLKSIARKSSEDELRLLYRVFRENYRLAEKLENHRMATNAMEAMSIMENEIKGNDVDRIAPA